jgi:hypothetical protein
MGSSGSVDFGIHFLETKNLDCPNTTVTSYLLHWGDSQTIDPNIKTWKLVFNAFDGTHREMAGSDSSNPFVKVVNQNGTFVIQVANADSVSWPPKP